MAKYKPGADPKGAVELYWYNRGYEEGLRSRTHEVEANQARADAKWAEIKTTQNRLHGIRALAIAMERITDAMGVD